jgi:hypothetical protein
MMDLLFEGDLRSVPVTGQGGHVRQNANAPGGRHSEQATGLQVLRNAAALTFNNFLVI